MKIITKNTIKSSGDLVKKHEENIPWCQWRRIIHIKKGHEYLWKQSILEITWQLKISISGQYQNPGDCFKKTS